jgi:ribonucleoside-diphosphate reductase alpha chain
MSLQYGVPLEVYVSKFSHTRFEPMGHTKNPDIRIAKSIVDYIFRWLGITFIPGYREAQQGLVGDDVAAPSPSPLAGEGRGEGAMNQGSAVGQAFSLTAPKPSGSSNGQKPAAARPKAAGAKSPRSPDRATPSPQPPAPNPSTEQRVDLNGGPDSSQSEQFAQFQVDAPSCDNCGSITVRSGNCYLCYNCGNSMGCS